MNISSSLEKMIKKEIKSITHAILEKKVEETIHKHLDKILKTKWEKHLEELEEEFQRTTLDKWEEFISQRAYHWDQWVKQWCATTRKIMRSIIDNLQYSLDCRIQDINNLTISTDKIQDLIQQMDKLTREEKARIRTKKK